ncbi:triphosphoribosyl-dephospho-CoA synthase [Natronorarus salvus]|uniref:triphosphoribosyl-dephospho-CoA synthase n=1 Tax=Natronorarus salvus TaxID=3117733 RepID=UPI003907F4E4
MSAEPMSRGPAENAQLALLLEVAGTPKPGNVDRRRDLPALRFEHFLAGAVGAGGGLRLAEGGEPVGTAFERAIAGMAEQDGGNTQFGCLLLLVPLVRAASVGRLSPEGVREVTEATTVEDSVEFYRAFEHVDVSVGDPPDGADALDARHGSAAASTLRERELTLLDVMSLSAEPREGHPGDANAREWVEDFPRTFAAAEGLLADEGPVTDRAARTFLSLLAEAPDTLVAVDRGLDVAHEVMERADTVAGDLEAAESLAEEFVVRGINPGTTADLTCAALFVALSRGLSV